MDLEVLTWCLHGLSGQSRWAWHSADIATRAGCSQRKISLSPHFGIGTITKMVEVV